MSTHANKTQEKKSQPVSSGQSPKQGSGVFAFQIVDNRPEAIAQRKLQEMADKSTRNAGKPLASGQEKLLSDEVPTPSTEPDTLKNDTTTPDNAPIQRYKTSAAGLTVAGELHTKPPEQVQLETAFARHIKRVEAPTPCYWTENIMPGSDLGGVKAASSENADHYVAWDIDRISHHYQTLKREIGQLLGAYDSEEAGLAMAPPTAARIAMSSSNIEETLTFFGADLGSKGLVKTDSRALADHFGSLNRLLRSYIATLKDAGTNGKILVETCRQFMASDEQVTRLLTAISATISGQQPEIDASRGVTYDFTRTLAMHANAKRLSATTGIWVIGQYHVQEIQENLRDSLTYDLLSKPNFDKDVRDFAAEQSLDAGPLGNQFGEVLIWSRIMKSSMEYFMSGRDREARSEEKKFFVSRFTEGAEAMAGIDLARMVISESVKPFGFNVDDLIGMIRKIQAVNLEFQKLLTPLPSGLSELVGEYAEAPDLYAVLRDRTLFQLVSDVHALTGLAEFKRS